MLSEQIMKSSPFSRIIVSGSMIVFLALAAYNWAVSPQTTYLHASQQYTSMNDTVQKKVLMREKIVNIKREKLKTTRGNIDELKADFFSPSQSSKFFSGIEELAEKSGCDIEMMAFKADNRRLASGLKIDKVKFLQRCASVEFVGEYGQIVDFLKNINDSPGHLSLGNLSINSSRDVRGLTCEMNITVYVSEDKELISDEDN